MLTSLPFLSKWTFLETMEDRRTMLFSYWHDLAINKILSAIHCRVLFFRSLAPQWTMICSGLFSSVVLMYNFICLCTRKRSDKNQIIFSRWLPSFNFLNYKVSNNHCNTMTLFNSFFLFCFVFIFTLIFLYVIISEMHLRWSASRDIMT